MGDPLGVASPWKCIRRMHNGSGMEPSAYISSMFVHMLILIPFLLFEFVFPQSNPTFNEYLHSRGN
jgi:hypothetical protein